MKAFIKMVLFAMPLLLAACDDDVKEPGKTPVGPGDGIQFTLTAPNESRTMYSDNWDGIGVDGLTKQDVYWGNYITSTLKDSEQDQIKIFCKNASKKQIATYNVTPNTTDNKNVAASLINIEEDGNMQWNTPGTVQNFYAFYPASQAGDKFLNNSDNTIRATVAPGQSPTSYRAVMGTEVWEEGKDVNVLQKVADNSNFSTSNKTTIYANPDMSAAIMVAKTSVTAQENNDPVPLNFNVLADVIDITLNGPVTPNQLSGNSNPDNSTTAIKIYTVTLEAFKTVTDDNGTHTEVDDSKIISGSFDLNMETGAISNPSGNATVQLLTSAIYKNVVVNGKLQDEEQFHPTLHARAEVTGGAPSADQVDQLRLRAFIIPGSIKSLDELQVRVMTNYGEYVQKLSPFALDSSDPITGKIYPIKLGYFYYRGTQFDLSRWIGQLNPNIYISELSIPGSWHSANSNYQAVTDLVTQYQNGIRAFEVQTRNGTDLFDYHNFDKEFDASNPEYFDTKYDENTVINTTAQRAENITFNNATGKYTAMVTVLQTRSYSYYLKPKYSLRLYRTANASYTKNNSLSDALMDIGNIMNEDGLVFAEIGMAGEQSVKVPVQYYTYEATRVKTGELEGTRSGTSGNYTYTWENMESLFTDADEWEPEKDYNPSKKSSEMEISRFEAWANAVDACLYRLANTPNPHTNQASYLYTEPITRFTTINNVKGRIIVKINTNNDSSNGVNNEGDYWDNPTQALFSRWVAGSADAPMTINLKWGGPIEPEPLISDDNALHWCFTELDNITDWNSSIEKRKAALRAMNDQAYENYKEGLHRTFYENMIGGYVYRVENQANCQEVARELNSIMLQLITDPSRKECPLGLVFMNYAVDPDNTYKSQDLIRAIINNNAAFLLNRADGTSGGTTTQSNVRQNTNSSFDNTTGTLSPLR